MKTQQADIIKREELPDKIWEYIYKERQLQRMDITDIVVVKRSILEHISELMEDEVRYGKQGQGDVLDFFEISNLLNNMKSDYLIIENS